MSESSILLSDGTTGSCFGKTGGGLSDLAKPLADLIQNVRIAQRKLTHAPPPEQSEKSEYKPSTPQNAKGWGSGKYPYKKFIKECLLPILLNEINECDKVLLVCYSFSCRAIGILFQSLTSEEVTSIEKKLLGIVMLAPPLGPSRTNKNVPIEFSSQPSKEESDAYKDYFTNDWANSYTCIPYSIPLHFLVGAYANNNKKAWTESLANKLNNQTTFAEIGQRDKKNTELEKCTETFESHASSVATAIQKIWSDTCCTDRPTKKRKKR